MAFSWISIELLSIFMDNRVVMSALLPAGKPAGSSSAWQLAFMVMIMIRMYRLIFPSQDAIAIQFLFGRNPGCTTGYNYGDAGCRVVGRKLAHCLATDVIYTD